MNKLHTSIKTLPVYNFYEILNTGQLKNLYVDELAENEKVKENLEEVWREIYQEYCEEAKVDNRHLKQKYKVEMLQLKHFKITMLLKLTRNRFASVRKTATKNLAEYGYIIRSDKSFKDEYKRLQGQLRALGTKIRIEEGKLPKEAKQEAVKLMKQVVALENIFPGRVIDAYVMSVQKWLALIEVANEKAKEMSHVR
jgi:hypothetical protein